VLNATPHTNAIVAKLVIGILEYVEWARIVVTYFVFKKSFTKENSTRIFQQNFTTILQERERERAKRERWNAGIQARQR